MLARLAIVMLLVVIAMLVAARDTRAAQPKLIPHLPCVCDEYRQ